MNNIKKTFSMVLLIYSIVVISVTIFDEQTRVADETHPAFAFVALWISLWWLALVEGSQASMVGLPPVDRSLYEHTHPITYKVCELGHRGDNLDRYLMGRQFLVLVLVFVINMTGTPTEDAEYRTELSDVLMTSGLAVILITVMIGQLNTQVTASHCMLDYMNTHIMAATLFVTMAIESSGLLHASYLIQIAIAKITTGKEIEITSNEEKRTCLQKLFFWSRVLMSLAVLSGAFIVTIAALIEEKTTMWEGVPAYVSVILLFILMAIVGMLEGMQIAFFAVSRVTDEERHANRWARWSCELLFGNEGEGLPGFMIGRQLCVASCFIVIARITTPYLDEGEDNILGVSDGLQKFFETGLLGAIMTTIVASISWQLVASAFPVAFLGNPITHILLRLCLLLEATGICSFAWVLSFIHQEFWGYEDDEVHSFMIGRQLCVASCFIVIARITTPYLDEGEDNILGVSDGLQKFFETGLLGAIMTTIVASISWQLIASTFPISFLGNPVTYTLLRVCLLLEATGICSFAWVLSHVHQEFWGYEDDEVHIGTAEDRAAKGKGDQHRKEGGMTGGAFPANFGLRKEKYLEETVSMKDLKEHMEDLQKQTKESKTNEEMAALKREIAYLEKVMEKRDLKQEAPLKTSGNGNNNTEDTDSLDP
eukprot:CAMPEP_0198154640 /NCGR_PEP_ID=MMETSP1443-20131203/68704_1 /TAXON_ID=186043 /ORGANISM="Entomoneis sp., Strain CCMP2396" /LENGTH=653 /DNA_ID=CAMNT_0043821327 /DNA_START=86 /DNA_END=2047 /DNA_ORIENTATION=-